MDDEERRRLLDEALYALDRAARAVEALREDAEADETPVPATETGPSLAQQVLRRLASPRLRPDPTPQEREERERLRDAARRHGVDERVLFALTKPPAERGAIERARIEAAAKQVAYEERESLFLRARLAGADADVTVYTEPETVPLEELERDAGSGPLGDESGFDDPEPDVETLLREEGLDPELVDGAAVGGALEADAEREHPEDPGRREP